MDITEYFEVNFEFAEREELDLKIKALFLAKDLSGAELDTLYQAWDVGLMESGDTPSKSGRAMLLQKGVLCQTCWKNNEYAFSVTYPLGYTVVKALTVDGLPSPSKE